MPFSIEGIGGKTTSGYGRFDKEQWEQEEIARAEKAEKARQEAERQATLAAMSPIERTINEILEVHRDKTDTRIWFKLYDELRKPDGCFQTPEDRRAVAERVKTGMQKDKVWKDKDKNGGRKKFIEEILGAHS